MKEYEIKTDIIEQREYKVYKANEIIQKARYELNILELKLFAFILSKVKPDDKEGQEYTITIKDYCMVCGMDEKNGANYIDIKAAIKRLRDKSFWMTDENGKEFTVGWLSKARVDKRSGKITVKLDEDIQKYVIGWFNQYTQYSLIYTLPMSSSYSFRIYELLQSYSYAHSHVFDIDDLKSKIGATVYVNFKDFRKRVLESATREINTYTDLEVDWEPINKGRKVIQVKFNIRRRDSFGQLEASQRASKQLDGQINMFDLVLNESAPAPDVGDTDKEIPITGGNAQEVQ